MKGSAPPTSARAPGRLGVTLLAGVALVASAAGATAAPTGRAVSASDAIGVESQSAACPDGRAIVVSSDRGRTWSERGCVPASGVFDPGRGSVVALVGERPIRIRLDGSQQPLEGGLALYHPVALATTDDSSGAYAIDRTPPPNASPFDPEPWRLWREGPQQRVLVHREGVGWAECAGRPDTSHRYFEIQSAGSYVAVVAEARTGESAFPGQAALALSADGCATWGPAVAVPGSFYEIELMADGSLVTGADAGNVARVSRDAGRTWTVYDEPFSGRAALDFVSVAPLPGRGERALVVLDDLSEPGFRDGWPATPRIGPSTPVGTGAPGKALEWVDSRFRRPLGLPDLIWDGSLAKAAQAHADYFARNGYSGHDEKPGRPGFTGRFPQDRCTAAGFSGSCGEVAHGADEIMGATRSWMETPFHGTPFLSDLRVGLGARARGGAVGNVSGEGPAPGTIVDLDAPANSPEASLRVWPFDGAKNVPTTWNGGERPDPLAAYTGDHDNVGPVLFAWSLSPATASLTGPGGRPVPLFAPAWERKRRTSAPSLPVGPGWSAVFAARRLSGQTRYTLHIDRDGVRRDFTFTTGRATSIEQGLVAALPLHVSAWRTLYSRIDLRMWIPAAGALEVRVLKGRRVVLRRRLRIQRALFTKSLTMDRPSGLLGGRFRVRLVLRGKDGVVRRHQTWIRWA